MIDIEIKNYEIGEIVYENQKLFSVKIGDDVIIAKKAFSCLVEPIVTDIVAIFTSDGLKYYIMAILERTPNNEHLSIKCQSLEIISDDINLKANFLNASFLNMQCVGERLELKSQTYKNSGLSSESIFIEDVNKSERSYKYIIGHEEVQCKSSRHLSEEARVVRAKNLIATAEDQVKIDGQNIHLA